MNEPGWIYSAVLIATHQELIAEHGGIEGIRDHNLLESACAAPKQLYHYSNPKPSLTELSARYAYSITRNPPFRDGNKRMAALACELFLEINDCMLATSDEEAYFVFIDLSSGNFSEKDLLNWLNQKIIPQLLA